MQRSAKRRHTNDTTRMQRVRQLRPAKCLEARPESNERRPRHLRLHRDEMLDGGERRRCPALQQHLPGEERAVERLARERGQKYVASENRMNAWSAAVLNSSRDRPRT